MDEMIDVLDENTREKPGKVISKKELNKFIKDKAIIPHVREYEILND